MNITKSIDEICGAIDAHLLRLNEESVWLFLTILGVWGVTNRQMQFVAFVLSFLFFVSRATTRAPSLSKQFRVISDSIESCDAPSAIKSQMISSLHSAKAKLSLKNVLRSAPLYFFSFAFLFLSFVSWFIVE